MNANSWLDSIDDEDLDTVSSFERIPKRRKFDDDSVRREKRQKNHKHREIVQTEFAA